MDTQVHYFQYSEVRLHNGNHQFTYNKFIELTDPKNGLTEEEIHLHLVVTHDVKEEASSDGLPEGFLWTASETAAGIFPIARDGQVEPTIVSSEDPDIAHLMFVAPEMFEFFW